MRSQLQRIIDGEIGEALAKEIIADARKSVDAKQRIYLNDLNAAVAVSRREVMLDHEVFLRDLNAVLAAEAALRRGVDRIETYLGAELYPITRRTLSDEQIGKLLSVFGQAIKSALLESGGSATPVKLEPRISDTLPCVEAKRDAITVRVTLLSKMPLPHVEIRLIGHGKKRKLAGVGTDSPGFERIKQATKDLLAERMQAKP